MPIDSLARFAPFFRPGFLSWLRLNRSIYEQFEIQATFAIDRGWQRFSARTIIEEIRHFTRMRENGNCSFKINNCWAPDLARVFTILHPQHAKLWEYRRPDWRAFLAAVELAHKQKGKKRRA
jgi:hypothetical protein